MNISKLNSINFGLKFSPSAKTFFIQQIKNHITKFPNNTDVFTKSINNIKNIQQKNEEDTIDILDSDGDKVILLKLNGDNKFPYLKLLFLNKGDNLSITNLKDIEESIKSFYETRK